MNLEPFIKVLATLNKIDDADREWFPRWIDRFAQGQPDASKPKVKKC